MAPTGATVNHSGSCEWLAYASTRANGFRPRAFAAAELMRTSAAGPSEIDEELAAGTRPSFPKAGLRDGIFSMLQVAGVSSRETTTSPLRVLTVTGVTSLSKAPDSTACRA